MADRTTTMRTRATGCLLVLGLSLSGTDALRAGANARPAYGSSSSALQAAAVAQQLVLDRSSQAPAVAPSPLSALSDGYGRLVQEHYLPMAFLQAGVLASGADVATQLMERGTAAAAPPTTSLAAALMPLATRLDEVFPALHLVAPPDDPRPLLVAHVLAMASVASTMSGAANAVWLRQLEARFPGRGACAVAAKTIIHATLLASIINSAYLVGVPLLTTLFDGGGLPEGPAAYVAGWTSDEFATLTKLEVCMFIPYNTLAFRFVPPGVRPLTHAAVSATFNVAVSAVTLGCFDAWCERATSIFA